MRLRNICDINGTTVKVNATVKEGRIEKIEIGGDSAQTPAISLSYWRST